MGFWQRGTWVRIASRTLRASYFSSEVAWSHSAGLLKEFGSAAGKFKVFSANLEAINKQTLIFVRSFWYLSWSSTTTHILFFTSLHKIQSPFAGDYFWVQNILAARKKGLFLFGCSAFFPPQYRRVAHSWSHKANFFSSSLSLDLSKRNQQHRARTILVEVLGCFGFFLLLLLVIDCCKRASTEEQRQGEQRENREEQ